MKKLVKMFLVVFVSIFILNFTVDSQDSNISEADTDKSCTGKQVKVYSPNSSDYQKISEDKAMQSENYLSGDKNTGILKLKPKAVSEYKDGLKNLQEIDPDELDLESENLVDIFKMQSGEFLAGYKVSLYTEADCDNITWTLASNTNSYTLSCGSHISFLDIPAGMYDIVFEGCGGKQEGYAKVTEDTNFVVCPDDLDSTDCCSEGVLTGGEYYCDDCSGNPTTIPTTIPTTTTVEVSYSSVYLCTETACKEGFEWTFGGQKHPDPLDCSTRLVFGKVSEGCYTSFVSGCGWVWEMDICVDGDSDKHYSLCPGDTDLDCCEEVGCSVSGGEYDKDFVCDGCPAFDISGKVEGVNDCISDITVNLSGAAEDEVKTNYNGGWEFVDVPGGGPYYINITTPDQCKCEPVQITISDLNSDLSGLSFSCSPPNPLPCPTEEIYGEDSEEVELLRHFRDNVLSHTPEGQEIIRLYYEWNPAIVNAIKGDEGFKEEVKEMVDGVLELIGGRGK